MTCCATSVRITTSVFLVLMDMGDAPPIIQFHKVTERKPQVWN